MTRAENGALYALLTYYRAKRNYINSTNPDGSLCEAFAAAEDGLDTACRRLIKDNKKKAAE